MFAILAAVAAAIAAILVLVHHGTWIEFWFFVSLALFFLHHGYAVAVPARRTRPVGTRPVE